MSVEIFLKGNDGKIHLDFRSKKHYDVERYKSGSVRGMRNIMIKNKEW